MQAAVETSTINRRLTITLGMSPNSPSVQLQARLTSTDEPPIETTGVSYLKVDPAQIAQVSSILSRLSLRGSVQSGTFSLDPVVDLGSQLFWLLFEGDLSRLYRQILSAESAGVSTPISIEPDADMLASIPWELLFDRSRNSFVALSPRTPLIRRRSPLPGRSYSPPVSAPLRVRLVESQMQKMFDPAEDEAMMSDLQHSFPGRFEVLEPLRTPTFEALEKAVREAPCDVLHFSGIGNFSSDEYGLKGERPRNIWMEPGKPTSFDQFHDMLRGARVSLFVLSTDNSAMFAREIAQTVPLVFGLQGQVATETMDKFEPAFYRTLLSGRSFETAVTRGRQAIDVENVGIRDWALIVAYSQLEDSRLVSAPASATRRLESQFTQSTSDAPEGQADPRLWKRLMREIEIQQTNLAALEERVAQQFDGVCDAETEEQINSTRETIERLQKELGTLKQNKG
jgi:hypothetical protein